jgi:hypothetical protein
MDPIQYTKEELTASDGRLWTPEEVELMAQWWEHDDIRVPELETVMSRCEGFEKWVDLPDPPAVYTERERIRLARPEGNKS